MEVSADISYSSFSNIRLDVATRLEMTLPQTFNSLKNGLFTVTVLNRGYSKKGGSKKILFREDSNDF